jgi:hypothetical protein
MAIAVIGSVDARNEPESTNPGSPPELGIAVAKDDRTLEIRRFLDRIVTQSAPSSVPSGVKIEVTAGVMTPTVSEAVSVVETHITRIDAMNVEVRRVDGSVVPVEVLMRELATPTPIILAQQGKQIDRLYSTIFKPRSLVLLLPSSATPMTIAPIPAGTTPWGSSKSRTTRPHPE